MSALNQSYNENALNFAEKVEIHLVNEYDIKAPVCFLKVYSGNRTRISENSTFLKTVQCPFEERTLVNFI